MKNKTLIRKYIRNLLKEEIVEKKLGQLGLDSGQLIMVDPSHLKNYKNEIGNMLNGEFKTDENQVKSLEDCDTGLYLSLFGGDGTFDVYGVYDTENNLSHIPYKLVIHTRNKKDFPKNMNIYEGTSNYYPGYSDDNTSDILSNFRDKTSKIINSELKNIEKKIIKSSKDDEQKFWNKWLYANLITTCLQDRFYINSELIKKALTNYQFCLKNPKIKQYTQKSYKHFLKQVSETLEKLKKEAPLESKKHYAPGFMEKR